MMERIRPLSKKKHLKVRFLLNAGNFVQKIIFPEHKHFSSFDGLRGDYTSTNLITCRQSTSEPLSKFQRPI